MTVNASRARHLIDDAVGVTRLRAMGQAAIVAGGYTDSIELGQIGLAYWHQGHAGDVPVGDLQVAVHVELIALMAGGPIKVTAQIDNVANMSNAPRVVAGGQISATGQYVLHIPGRSISKIAADTNGPHFLALHVDLDVGASQSINFSASLAGSSR
jgi:hypothetical protein